MKRLLTTIVGLITTLFAIFLYGKTQGRKEEVTDKTVTAKKVENEVKKLDTVELDKRGHKWVRDKNN